MNTTSNGDSFNVNYSDHGGQLAQAILLLYCLMSHSLTLITWKINLLLLLYYIINRYSETSCREGLTYAAMHKLCAYLDYVME